jgi:large subunit ribosomal protein L31e
MEERAYTIPIRTVYNRAIRRERAKKAMKYIREFIAKHMKVEPDNVKIHVSVNQIVWQRGIEKPPRKVKVVAVKDGETVWVYTPEERARLEKEIKRQKKRAARKTQKKAETVKEEKKAEEADKTEEKKETKKKAKKEADEKVKIKTEEKASEEA